MFSIYIILFWLLLVVLRPTRKVALALLPWLLFAVSYDSMRFYPNYKVNPIDVRGLFEAERLLFGIATASGTVIPGEWFNMHNCAVADFMAGVIYVGFRCRWAMLFGCTLRVSARCIFASRLPSSLSTL